MGTPVRPNRFEYLLIRPCGDTINVASIEDSVACVTHHKSHEAQQMKFSF
jgi:hypothetical protein